MIPLFKYSDGYRDGALAERAVIVAWLDIIIKMLDGTAGAKYCELLARAIERGDHAGPDERYS
jgi:hypothetical protein